MSGTKATLRGPSEVELRLPAGAFRALCWGGQGGSAIFLHGLTGTADVWAATMEALGPRRPSAWAVDQRGHGGSVAAASGYDIGAYAGDLVALVKLLRVERPHLVGHSMGARVAMVAAARHPELFRSVAIVDIGPEAWRGNWESTIAGIERMPATFKDEGEALAALAQGRAVSPERAQQLLGRLRKLADGSLTWRGSRDAWKQTVRSHRSRNYWAEWRKIGIPALLVRGGTSAELRPAIAERMRRENPRVRYEELEGVGHNVPLIAPERLARALESCWRSAQG